MTKPKIKPESITFSKTVICSNYRAEDYFNLSRFPQTAVVGRFAVSRDRFTFISDNEWIAEQPTKREDEIKVF